MPLKLIGAIILLILVTIFAGVNLDNKCNVNFVFYTFNNIPVFMTVIISFAAGAILMFPFTLFRRKKKTPEKPSEQNPSAPKIEDNSKTLFDFKIKREAAKDEKTEKKHGFGFGKKKSESTDKNADEKSEKTPSSQEDTGTPV